MTGYPFLLGYVIALWSFRENVFAAKAVGGQTVSPVTPAAPKVELKFTSFILSGCGPHKSLFISLAIIVKAFTRESTL